MRAYACGCLYVLFRCVFGFMFAHKCLVVCFARIAEVCVGDCIYVGLGACVWFCEVFPSHNVCYLILCVFMFRCRCACCFCFARVRGLVCLCVYV